MVPQDPKAWSLSEERRWLTCQRKRGREKGLGRWGRKREWQEKRERGGAKFWECEHWEHSCLLRCDSHAKQSCDWLPASTWSDLAHRWRRSGPPHIQRLVVGGSLGWESERGSDWSQEDYTQIYTQTASANLPVRLGLLHSSLMVC